MIFSAILLLLTAPAARAEDEPRKPMSSVSLRADGGGNNYHFLGLRTNYAFDEVYRGEAELNHMQAQGSGATLDSRAGLSARFAEAWKARGAFQYSKEPNRINGWGFNLGLDWIANLRDENEHETVLRLDFSRTTYHQKGTAQPVASRNLVHRFIREEWTFTWEQEVNESLRTFVFYSANLYASSPENLVNTATDFRPRRLARGTGNVSGLPEDAFGAGADLVFSEDWRGHFDFAHSKVKYQDNESTSLSPGVSVQVDNDWWLGFNGSYYLNRFPIDDQLLAGLSLTYEF